MTDYTPLGTYNENIGSPPVAITPANSSLLVADSRYRSTQNESPANFICKLTAALSSKQIFYRNLVWNQPLYSHNLTNNMLVYSIINGKAPPSHMNSQNFKLVTFARPWYSYKSFDGNPPGSAYQTPTGDSYANMMEYALNNQNRDPLNLPYLYLTGQAVYYNAADAAPTVCNVYFRYNSTRGFAIFAEDIANPTRSLQIKIHPESTWISKGHFIHGFGVYNPKTSTFETPISYQYTYYAESLPLLLPDRYITIVSPELTRDRKIQSFHSTNLNNFNHEVAIMSVNYTKTGIFHSNPVNEDSTTISIRTGYSPQSFTISILDEDGLPLECDNIMGNVVTNGPGVDIGTLNILTPWEPEKFIKSPILGGSYAPWYMMNYLLFGFYNSNWNPDSVNFPAITYLNYRQINYNVGNKKAKMLCEDVIHVFTTIISSS